VSKPTEEQVAALAGPVGRGLLVGPDDANDSARAILEALPDGWRLTRDASAEPTLDQAWREAEAALPGWELMLGRALDCRSCLGYWATARWAGDVDGSRHIEVVSSEDNRPRGQHHDPTPTAALKALTEKLRGKP
jgi:hypothetical protein